MARYCSAENRTVAERIDEQTGSMLTEDLGFKPCRHRTTRRVKGEPDLCARHRELLAIGNPNVRLR